MHIYFLFLFLYNFFSTTLMRRQFFSPWCPAELDCACLKKYLFLVRCEVFFFKFFCFDIYFIF